MAAGDGNKLIASELTISESTVKTHVANIFQKLEVGGRTDAVTKAIRMGIISVRISILFGFKCGPKKGPLIKSIRC